MYIYIIYVIPQSAFLDNYHGAKTFTYFPLHPEYFSFYLF